MRSCESVVTAVWYMEHTRATVATAGEPSLRDPPPRRPPPMLRIEPVVLPELNLRSNAFFTMFDDTNELRP